MSDKKDDKGRPQCLNKGEVKAAQYVKKGKANGENGDPCIRLQTPLGKYLCFCKDIDRMRMKFPVDNAIWGVSKTLASM